MIHWKNNNIALFHIPRTGGISAKVFFNSLFGHGKIIKTEYLKFHEPLYKKRNLLTPEVFDSINVISNIRNPFEYLISLYSYTQHTISEYRMKLFYKKEIVDLILSLDFHEFVYWYVENGLSFKDYLFIDGKLLDNVFINKLETFFKDVVNTLVKLNFKPNLITATYGIHNESDRNKYSCHYTNEMVDKVHTKFKWAFENYYKKEIRG